MGTTVMTLAEAGMPTPDLSPLRRVREWFGQAAGVDIPMLFYGSVARNLALLGHMHGVGDVDVAMEMKDLLSLKPANREDRDVRKEMLLHEPHLLFMLHQMVDGTFFANERPVVLRLRAGVEAEMELPCPVGVTLFTHPVTVEALLADNDLGFSAIVSDGETCWVTEDWVRDATNRTMTMVRCRDARGYRATMQRIERFTQGLYAGWTPVIPLEFAHFAEEAARL